jgi:hypothetical protein
MKGTRLRTMASVLVTLVAPAAHAVVSHPAEEKVQRKHAAQESFSAWQIPAPGQTLGRIPSSAPLRESFGALGEVHTVDPVTQEAKSRIGRLPLDLARAFGGKKAWERWVRAAVRTDAARSEFSRHIEAQLRAFVEKHKAELAVDGLTLNWDAQRFYVDSEFVFASFFISAASTTVEGAELTFRFNGAQLVNVITKTFGVAKAGLVPFSASESRAAESAKAVLGPEARSEPATLTQRWIPRAQGKNYVFEPAIRFDALSATGEKFTVVAHSRRNEILSWNAHTVFFETRINGVVNQRLPKGPQVTVGMPYVQGQSKSGGWFGRTKTYEANATGVMQVSGDEPVRVQLSSSRFKVQNSGGNAAVLDASGEGLFDARSNSTLAENTTYYHLHVALNWARPVINPRWFSSQVVANVNMNDICNAFWNGRSVNFFQSGSRALPSGKTVGCSNTGEIADVVYHEWGHGLHHNTSGIRDRAFSEGIGDTVSQLITGSPDVGPGFFSDGRPVRNLDGNYMYPPKENEREVHKEGLIFGSTYFHLTQALVEKYGNEVGRATARQWFLKMLYTTSQYTDSYEAILALDTDPFAGEDVRGANYCLINATFARHGLATKDAACR